MNIDELSKKLSEYLLWSDDKSWEEEVLSIIIPFGGHTGTYDLDYTPYFKQVLKDLDDETLEIIGIMCPAQIGKTVFLMIIGLLWCIKFAVPVYFLVNTIGTGIELMTNKVVPLVMANKCFKDKLIKDTTTGNVNRSSLKQNTVNFVNGGSFNIINAGARQSLKGKTTSLVIIDEYAECVKSSPRALGDMLERAYSRISQFTGHNRKILLASTPTIEGEDIDAFSRTAYNFRYEHTCIHCSASNEIRFENVRLENYEKKDDTFKQRKAIEDKERIIYHCPECGAIYYEYEKRDMMTRCEWRKIDEESLEADMRKKCYSFQGTYSHRPWKEIYLQYLGAKANPAKLRTFKNDVLAEPWMLETIKTKLDMSSIHKGFYPRGEANDEIINIATGIDVQTESHSIYCSVVGFNKDKKYNIIDWRVIAYENYEELKDIIRELHRTKYGNIQNSYTFVDTGSRATQIYEVCKAIGKKCIPCKGTDNHNMHSLAHRANGIDKPLNVHANNSNIDLDNYITEGEILFPSDFEDITFLEHLQAEYPKQTSSGKIVYIKKTTKGKDQNDYRDALRYVVFGGNYYSLHKKQSTGAILNRR